MKCRLNADGTLTCIYEGEVTVEMGMALPVDLPRVVTPKGAGWPGHGLFHNPSWAWWTREATYKPIEPAFVEVME